MKKLFFVIILVGACWFLLPGIEAWLALHFGPKMEPPATHDPQVLVQEPPATHDPQVLVSLLEKSSGQEVVIPPGTYRFCDTAMKGVEINGWHRRTLVADGVTFVFKPGQAFQVTDCEDVTVCGLTVDFDPLPFTQGTITEIDADKKSLLVKLEEGFVDLESLGKSTHETERLQYIVFDSANSEPRALLHDGFHEIAPLGERTYRLSRASNGFLFDSLGRPDAVQVGDRMALLSRGRSAVEIAKGNRITLDRVTVLAAPGFGFWESQGEGGNVYRRCRILRKPGTPRLIAVVADGLHSYQMRKGPLIEDCEFSDVVDDTIAIHGFFSLLLEAPSPRTVHIVSPFGQDFSVGAKVAFHEIPHGRFLGEATVTSFENLPAESLARPVAAYRQGFIEGGLNMRDLPVTQPLKVTLDADIAVPPGKLVLVSCDERSGSGAVVRNNRLSRGHTRGVIAKAFDVLIEGNRFEGIGGSAVLIHPEFYFLEGPMPRGVTIRNNTIVHCGWMTLNHRFAFAFVGAIQAGTLVPRRQFPPQFDPYPLLRDVSVSGNTIRDSAAYGILLGNVSGGDVTGNIVSGSFSKPGAAESKGLLQAFDASEHTREKLSDKASPPAEILIYGSENVKVQGNSFPGAGGPGMLPSVIIGPWCENVGPAQ